MDHQSAFYAFITEPRSWVAVAIVLFVVLFGGKLWGAAAVILDNRADTIRAELEEASALRAEAEKMLLEASSRRESAMKEAAELLASAKHEAQRLAAEARDEAVVAAKRREKLALERIEAAEKAALVDVRNQAATIAIQAAEIIVREGLSADAASRLVGRAIDALPAALAAQ
jgi:F-type H+-transporting ATPase subunit b